MNKNIIIQKSVDEAYYKITSIATIKAYISGGYSDLILNKDNLNYANEIINELFKKISNEIKIKVKKSDIDFIEYKSFCFNNPSNELINDCFKIVNKSIKTNKKSSNKTTLIDSLNLLSNKYIKEELAKSLDTIFDILLDYYTIIR